MPLIMLETFIKEQVERKTFKLNKNKTQIFSFKKGTKYIIPKNKKK